MHTFLFLLCIILALVCGTYGIAVRAIGSGTAFFAVWLVLAVFFICVALGQFTRNYTQTTKRGLLTTNKG